MSRHLADDRSADFGFGIDYVRNQGNCFWCLKIFEVTGREDEEKTLAAIRIKGRQALRLIKAGFPRSRSAQIAMLNGL